MPGTFGRMEGGGPQPPLVSPSDHHFLPDDMPTAAVPAQRANPTHTRRSRRPSNSQGKGARADQGHPINRSCTAAAPVLDSFFFRLTHLLHR